MLDQLLPAGRRVAQGVTPAATKPSAAIKERTLTVAQHTPKPRSKTEVAPASIKAKQPSSKPQSAVNDKIMKIIAEEAGVEVGDLKLETPFDECGIDSLLSLNISNTIQDQLGIPVDSSAFDKHPTIGELLRHLGNEPSAAGAAIPGTESSDPSSSSVDSDSDEDSASTLATSDDNAEELLERGSADKTMAVIKAVIAEEIGLEDSDIAASVSFVDLGIDSLLTLNITSKLQEVLPNEIPESLLAENDTLDNIEKSLGLKPRKTTNKEPTHVKTSLKEEEKRTSKEPDSHYATAHLLQGNSKSALKKLFLLPDGSGSAFSYAKLSAISPSVAVYGLSCPWQKDPWSMVNNNVTFSDLSVKFISAIRKVQPDGPYHLGGWSAGGISAYDITQKLFASGEETANLILLDSPNPVGLENPPQRMYDFFDKLDFFGMQGQKPPKWLRAHFDAFLTILDDHKVSAWKEGKAPKTHIVYAKDGVCSMLKPEDPRPEIRDDDPREMKWLLNTRTDFNAGGWKSLVGEKNVSVAVLEDVHHFSLVDEGPKAKDLAAFIRTAMGE